jgi:Glycosyl transferase family 2
VSRLDSPAMSVVLVMPDRFETVRKTIWCLLAQTEIDQLEIVIVTAPGADSSSLIESLEGRCRYRVIEHPVEILSEARAAGALEATAPITAFAEDHSYPEPDWAEALVAAYREPRGAVGPVLMNANPTGVMSWADMILNFGPWLAPGQSGTTARLPWHNTSYLARPLLDFGPSLGALLEAESFLQEQLRAKGYELYQESMAKTHHVNFSLLIPFLQDQYHGRRVYAAARVRHQRWSVSRRLAYVAASPLILLLQLKRVIGELRRSGGPRPRLLKLLPILALGLGVDAVGEVMGYAFGRGNSHRRKSDLEYDRERFISARDRRELAERYPTQAAHELEVPGHRT